MADVKRVGIREFCGDASRFLGGAEAIAVSDHGRIVGVYIPLRRDNEVVQQAVDRLDEAVNKILRETGMSEDELVMLLDPRS
jgi:hypothetical protein